MRKARLALWISLAAGGVGFAWLAVSAQSTVAETSDLTTDIATAGQDAQVLHTVIISEKKIIAEGVNLVPQAEPLALHVVRPDNQILPLAQSVQSDSTAAGIKKDIVGISHDQAAVNAAMSQLISAFYIPGGIARAGATAGKRHRFKAAVVLYDLKHAAVITIRLMKRAMDMN